jgi:hypothetical protein
VVPFVGGADDMVTPPTVVGTGIPVRVTLRTVNCG